jgi:hypothetical protein
MTPSYRPAKIGPIPDIVVGCVDTTAARALERHLRYEAELTVTKIDGANVHVPWTGAEVFLHGLFERAVSRGWVTERTAATAVPHRLREMELRHAALAAADRADQRALAVERERATNRERGGL